MNISEMNYHSIAGAKTYATAQYRQVHYILRIPSSSNIINCLTSNIEADISEYQENIILHLLAKITTMSRLKYLKINKCTPGLINMIL